MANRTTHRSKTGTKLYAVRDNQAGSKIFKPTSERTGKTLRERVRRRNKVASSAIS